MLMRVVSIIVSAAMAVAMIPFASLAEGTGQPDQSSNAVTSGNESVYEKIIKPDAPSAFVAEPGTHNPYGRDVDQPFLLSEKMELLTMTSYNLDRDSDWIKKMEYGSGLKNRVNTGKTQPQETGVSGYYSENNLWNENSRLASGFQDSGNLVTNWDSKYNLSYAQGVAWDPLGTGRKDHAAFCGAYFDSANSKAHLRVWTVNVRTGEMYNTVDLGTMDWLGSSTLAAYEGNNYFAITAGDYNGDGKDGLVVYFPGSGSSYGLSYLHLDPNSYQLTRDNTASQVLLHDTYGSYELKSSSSKRDRLCVALDSGDVNGDNIDDLVVLSYIQYPSSSAFLSLDTSLYRPYVAVSLGDKSLEGGGADIVHKKSGGSGIISTGTMDGKKTVFETMVSPGLSLGNTDGGARKNIVIAGLQNKIVSKENNPDKADDAYSALKSTFDHMEIAVYTVTDSGGVNRSYFGSQATNKWTRGGTYSSDDVWPETMVKCAKINGADQPALTFISGTLYQVTTSNVVKVFEPDYFQHTDDGAESATITNTHIASVTAGVFDGNEYGREQVAFSFGLKTSGKHVYRFKYGIIGGCEYNESFDHSDKEVVSGIDQQYSTNAKSFWSNDIDSGDNGYVISGGKGDYLEQNLNCVVLAVDKNDDGTYVRFSEGGAGWLYANPVVEAVIQAAPYFGELGQTAGGTTYTMTTSFGSSKTHSDSFAFGGGLADDFKSEGVAINVKIGGTYKYSYGYVKSFTRSYSQSFKAAGKDTVVLSRTPVLTYSYDVFSKERPQVDASLYTTAYDKKGNQIGYWRLKALTVTVPQKPAAVQLSIEDYNSFVTYYNQKADEIDHNTPSGSQKSEISIPRLVPLDEDHVQMAGLTGNEGNPWAYRTPWESSTAENPGLNLMPGNRVDLGTAGGSNTLSTAYSETESENYSHTGGFHFDIAIKGGFDLLVVDNYTGGYFSFDYSGSTSWSTSRGNGTSIAGTVNDLNASALVPAVARDKATIEQYKFKWGFGQYGLLDKDGKSLCLDGNKTKIKKPSTDYQKQTEPQTGKEVDVIKFDYEDVVNQTLVLAYAIEGGTLKAPLSPPSGLKVEQDGSTVNLKWEAPLPDTNRLNGGTASKYNIYTIDPTGQATKIGEKAADGGTGVITYSLDTFIAGKQGQIITFAVSAVDSQDIESIYSNKISYSVGSGGGGQNGKSAYELAVEQGYVGTLEEWLESLIGSDGLSAYQVAVKNGFIGSETDWLKSLIGATGESGKSAYQVAVQHGYTGTEEQWLVSLEGEDGLSAYEIYVKNVVDSGDTPENHAKWDKKLTEAIAALAGNENAEDYFTAFYNLYKSEEFAGEGRAYSEEKWMEKLAEASGYYVYKEAVKRTAISRSRWLELLERELTDSSMESYYEFYKNRVLESAATPSDYQVLPMHEWLTQLMGNGGYRVYYETVFGEILSEQEWLNSLKGNGIDRIEKTTSADGATWYYTIYYTDEEMDPYVIDIPVPEEGKSAYQSYVKNCVEARSVWNENLREAFERVGEDAELEAVQEAAYQVFVKAMQKADPDGVKTPDLDTWTADITDLRLTATSSILPDDITADEFKELALSAGGYNIYKNYAEEACMSETEWLESLKGKGTDGKSSYELAVEHGYEGTEEQWLASLAGAKGEKGEKGASGSSGSSGSKGDKGNKGDSGLSAYALAVQQGYSGTLDEWLASLKGADGAPGAAGPRGADGTNGIDGSNGLSAYELAVSRGFTGTLDEWLESLKGSDGPGSGNYATETGSESIVSFGDGNPQGYEPTDYATVKSAAKGLYVDANDDVIMLTDDDDFIVLGHMNGEILDGADGGAKLRRMEAFDAVGRNAARGAMALSLVSLIGNTAELVWLVIRRKRRGVHNLF